MIVFCSPNFGPKRLNDSLFAIARDVSDSVVAAASCNE